MGSLYGAGYSGYSGSSGVSGISGPDGTTLYSHSDFRLTLESNVPISSSNQEAKTTLYMTPYVGNQICLNYNGVWGFYDTNQISISLSGKTANKNHDVFAYYTGSAVALDLVEWTNDSTRSTTLVRTDGVWRKNGSANYKYIGTIRTTGTTGQCEDSFTSRYVWNMYNRFSRWGFTTNTNASWTWTGVYNTWREFNGGSGQIRFKFVIGMPQTFYVEMHGQYLNPSATAYMGYAVDSASSSHGYYVIYANILYVARTASVSNVYLWSPGYHYVTGVEDNSAGTITNYGAGSTTSAGYNHTVYLDS